MNGRAAFERVILVGDRPWDAAAAQALGVPFVGRASGERVEVLRARGATTVLSDFTDLGAVLTAFETAAVPLAVPS